MLRIARRYQKALALGLLVLNLTGARAISVVDPCRSGNDFFGPSLGFRGIVATVMKQDFKKPVQHSLGERARRYSSHEFEGVTASNLLTPKAIAPSPVAVLAASERVSPLYSWKLPADDNPVQPPHLHSKK